MLYSPWVQEKLRVAVVEMLDGKPGTEFRLDRLSISFPLDVSLGGLLYKVNGDTLMAADNAEVRAELLPLITGEAKIAHLNATGVCYNMGNRDSLTAIGIKADTLALRDSRVKFAGMDIDLRRGEIAGGRVSLWINPDSVSTDTTTSAPTDMKINVGSLELRRFSYIMQLMPTIDSLGCTIDKGTLANGLIDLKNQNIDLKGFTGSGLHAVYMMPDSAGLASVNPPKVVPDKSPSEPWTVKVGLIDFDKSTGLYTTRGYKPEPGLDFGYIQADSMRLTVKNFYNRETDVSLPITLEATERCGVRLMAKGTLDINAQALLFKKFNILTAETDLDADGMMGSGDLATDPRLPLALSVSGHAGLGDLGKMFPFAETYFKALPRNSRLDADIDVDGTTGRLKVSRLDLKLKPVFSLKGSGELKDVFAERGLGGNIAFNGRLGSLGGLKEILLGKDSGIDIPPMDAFGNIAFTDGSADGDLRVVTGKGEVKLIGGFNANSENYSADLKANGFPVQAFLPGMDIGEVTANLSAKGHGFSPFSKRAVCHANLNIGSLAYSGYVYKDIAGTVDLEGGQASVNVQSHDPSASASLIASGNLDGDTYRWNVKLNGNSIDLQALGFSTTPAKVSTDFNADLVMTPKSNDYKVKAGIASLDMVEEFSSIALKDINLDMEANDSLTRADITNRDALISFTAPYSLPRTGQLFGDAATLASKQIYERSIGVDTLQKTLPKFDLDVIAGKDNFISDILKSRKMGLDSLYICCKNDTSLDLRSYALQLSTESMTLDTLSFDMLQHGNQLQIDGKLRNRPGNMDEWSKVNLTGYIAGNQMALRLTQYNVQNKNGFDFGLLATVTHEKIDVHFMPLFPVINYKAWNLNFDNYITYQFNPKHIDANVRMTSDKSKLEVYTEHREGDEHQEDLVMMLQDIHLQDWLAFNPFMPAIRGDLSANVRLNRVPESGDLNGKGFAELTDFEYGKEKVGNFKADFDVTTDRAGKLQATADLFVNGAKTMTLAGVLNDSTATSPFALDFSMIHFPLTTVNPFMPAGTAKLRGTLNGSLKISGDSNNPVFNGFINFDSTAVKLALTGAEYKFSGSKIPVDSGMVTLTDFEIAGVNGEPLKIDGTVALRPLSNPTMDLKLSANNMQLVNNLKPAKGADVYGKAFISLDGTVKGNMDLLRVKADLKLLSGTNVTYVIPNATSAIESQATEGMVKFVNLSDTTAVAAADSLTANGMALLLQALLTIQNGTTVNVDLSPDGKDKISLNSNGTLDFSMTPVTDGRLSGRLNIDGGFVRYSPPVISQKYFTFREGSYIAFSGDMLNPTLNIDATDVIKANVTQEGQDSRLVNFDVGLSVTGTLKTMKVLFDLSTRDDITVQNELESMSADQRQNQAINLMLYNVYTGPGTRGDASLGGNPLMSFLASTANSWLANNIKGVDISLGINQYDRTVNGSSSQTMSYSYQVSKSLFNDRLRIIVGGNYSTDANADENFSQNLINDISFEYFINRARTMYLRIFRHTGYESILEGEVTSTGVGFAYRRKGLHFKNLFGLGMKDKKKKDKEAEKEAGKASMVRFKDGGGEGVVPEDSIPKPTK